MTRTATSRRARRAHRRPADRRLAGRLAAPRLPRRGAARPARPDRGGGGPAARARGRTAAGVRRTAPGDAADRAGGGLRRHLRQPAAAQPVPHLLRARRHPQARDGAAAVQADLPRVGVRADRHRAARPPVRGAGVRRHRRPRAGSPADPRPPRRARAAADLAHRGGLALGRRRRGGHRHAAAAPGRREGRRPPARRRGAARGGGRPDAVRHPGLRPRAGAAGRPDTAADAVVPRGAADGHLPLGDRALPVPDDLRGRPLLALPLRQVRLDHALLAALRGPDAADRQPALPLRDARRRRRPRHRPAGARSRGPTRSAISEETYHVVAVARRAARRRDGAGRHGDPDLPTAHRGTGLLGDHADGQGDVRLPRRW